MRTDAIGWSSSGSVRLLDQTALPAELRYLEADSVEAMAEAIRARRAPLIGIAAAMGLAAEAAAVLASGYDTCLARRGGCAPHLRPATAVNLGWAGERARRVGREALARGGLPVGPPCLK